MDNRKWITAIIAIIRTDGIETGTVGSTGIAIESAKAHGLMARRTVSCMDCLAAPFWTSLPFLE